ncbi:MAG: hypothetical protein QM831_13425 [Kofleriaceae bacterium]
MKLLVIGGNRFMGKSLAIQLAMRGHEVTAFNRGSLPTPVPVVHDFALLKGRWDAVIDFNCMTAEDARRMLSLHTNHYVMISTGQVYLVREGLTGYAKESDYDGPVMASHADHEDWLYGIEKRAAEDVVAAAGIRTTRLRIPMVNGEGDWKRRFDAYLWRMFDRGPLFVPDPDVVTRHVYRKSVVDALVAIVERKIGGAFNLAQEELLPLRELIERIGHAAGVTPTIVAHPLDGLDVRAASPYSSRWMSRLDPAKIIAELDLKQTPAAQYIASTVQHILANWSTPPDGYAQRATELALAHRRSPSA